MSKTLYLYTTVGCHLCEQAELLLDPLLEKYQLYLKKVEIAESDALIARYGVRIPVLRPESDTRELGWPFDTASAEQFLAAVLSC